ncbi:MULTISPECIES: site-specific DNA-methyltransferase [unclassified Neisseria]|uniref:site-specific DNA-methyltransferase n=1 Tax=unclassified Neisseria TaxID=2623750 RepID=UPI002664E88B|nr:MULTISPECIES: site-specific DNA-methyltransferase [unclassified Neisseria]MDO1510782.1 site-specific DNA-methyltransferase [Neisseria sp. MVDL19-042950]MDO1517107.1 site-specific DNA-methyltransferase [Neisseria sp. MVDL18-041461]MDO1564434.1 site-specific DNA-methyltransferase [Neisseria sp. MVDL20-010259]
MKNQKLELTWIGKHKRPKLEARILLEEADKSYHAKVRSEKDIFDNRLIFGDNLLALKALEQEFAGKVKCIYIDPPYNTGQAFTHYDDGLEHSIWLSLMKERFELLRKLLTKDGVIFCQLNDDEAAYCKVLLDEVFGRNNFINQVSVKMKQTAGASGGGEDKRLKKNIEYILIYSLDRDSDLGFQKFNDVYDEEDLFEIIDEMEDSGKSWKYTSVLLDKGKFVEERTVLDGAGNEIKVKRFKGVKRTTINALMRGGSEREDAYSNNFEWVFSDTNAQTSIRTRIMDEFSSLADDELLIAEYVPRSGRGKGTVVQHYYISPTIRRVIWLKDTAVKRGRRIVKLEKAGTYWDGFPLNNLTKEGGVQFPNGKKPELLIRKILELATNPGDLVLDSFAGSGTTGAVAHKMGRRWIMVELGEHCHTHIIPRLQKVIDGTDQGGISKAVNWQGGGGFRYYRLAPTLIVNDKWGNPIINPDYNPEMLAEALAKLEGFTYRPSETHWWQHGFSSECDFIYVTTQSLSAEQLQALSDEVGEGKSLLICCSAWRGLTAAQAAERFPNLTLKKIPKMILARCEWGHDDYSLNVANLPFAETEPLPEKTDNQKLPVKAKKGKRLPEKQEGLFDGEEQ